MTVLVLVRASGSNLVLVSASPRLASRLTNPRYNVIPTPWSGVYVNLFHTEFLWAWYSVALTLSHGDEPEHQCRQIRGHARIIAHLVFAIHTYTSTSLSLEIER